MLISPKVCSSCKQEKHITEFSQCAAYKDGHRGQCRGCRKAYQKRYVKEHPEVIARHSKIYVSRRSRAVVGRAEPKYKYGITEKEFDRILAAQKGRCAICLTDAPGGRYNKFNVDHCHETMHVRGILCNRCNVVLGAMGDNLGGVLRFLTYLRKAEKKQAKNKDGAFAREQGRLL